MPHTKNCKDCAHYEAVTTGDIRATYGYCKRRPPIVQFIPVAVQAEGAPVPQRKSRLLAPADEQPQMMQWMPATARPRVDAEGFNSGCGEGEPVMH